VDDEAKAAGRGAIDDDPNVPLRSGPRNLQTVGPLAGEGKRNPMFLEVSSFPAASSGPYDHGCRKVTGD